MIDLFPYSILRLAKSSQGVSEVFSNDVIPTAILKRNDCTSGLDSLAKEIDTYIYQLVGNPVVSRDVRNSLLQIKRRIARKDFIGKDFDEILQQYFEGNDPTIIERYNNSIINSDKYEKMVSSLYNERIISDRNTLKNILNDEELLRGLMFASFDYYQQLSKYMLEGASVNESYNYEIKTLKYLTRIFKKTSPFSTFTKLILLRESPSLETIAHLFDNQDVYGMSVVKPNSLFLSFLQAVIMADFDLRSNLNISVNNSYILSSSTEYLFLVNTQNFERLLKIHRNEMVDECMSIVASNPGKSYRDIYSIMHEKQSMELINTFEYLLKIEFLEYDLPIVSNYQQWLLEFKGRFLQELPVTLNILLQLCDQITKTGLDLSSMPVKFREDALSNLYICINDSWLQLFKSITSDENFSNSIPSERIKNTPTFPISINKLFYEDYYDTHQGLFNGKKFFSYASTIEMILERIEEVTNTDGSNEALAKIFFENNHSPKDVSLLKLYSQYTDIFTKNKDKWNELSSNPEVIQKKNNWFNYLSQLYVDKYDSVNGRIKISSTDIESINVKSGFAPKVKRNTSTGAMIQVVTRKGKDTKTNEIVLNSVFRGNGKMYSRFIDGFGNILATAIRKHNIAFPDAILVENCDSSLMNANIHPLLTSKELRINSGQNLSKTKRWIMLNELLVNFDETESRLFLTDKYGNKINVVDLGFQGIGRSSLFSFLDSFSSNKEIDIKMLSYPGWWRNEQLINNQVILRPEIIIDDTVVIQRKAWIFPKHFLPHISNGKLDYKNYCAVMEWKNQYALPNSVFIIPSNTTTNSNDHLDSKPQYINFTSPFLCELFINTIRNIGVHITLEESVPDDVESTTLKGVARTCEFLIEWRNI